MKAKHLVSLAAFLLLVSCLFDGGKKSGGGGGGGGSILGTWGSDEAEMVFNEDKTYTVSILDSEGVNFTESGTYSVSGSRITFSPEQCEARDGVSGSMEPKDCEPTSPTTFSVSGSTLTLKQDGETRTLTLVEGPTVGGGIEGMWELSLPTYIDAYSFDKNGTYINYQVNDGHATDARQGEWKITGGKIILAPSACFGYLTKWSSYGCMPPDTLPVTVSGDKITLGLSVYKRVAKFTFDNLLPAVVLPHGVEKADLAGKRWQHYEPVKNTWISVSFFANDSFQVELDTSDIDGYVAGEVLQGVYSAAKGQVAFSKIKAWKIVLRTTSRVGGFRGAASATVWNDFTSQGNASDTLALAWQGARLGFHYVDSAGPMLKDVPGTAPTIVAQPVSVSVHPGDEATFRVSAQGTKPLAYRWFLGADSIPGADDSLLILDSVALEDKGAKISVRVSNAFGSVVSDTAVLVVGEAAIPSAILSGPATQSVLVGASAVFTVTAEGTAPLTYKWYRNGALIAGASSASYKVDTAKTADNGASFTVVVKNSAGSDSSSPALLVVMASAVAPSITVPPETQIVFQGVDALFSVTADGTAPLTYQWYKNDAPIAGATKSAYTAVAPQLSDNGAKYKAVVSNSAGKDSAEAVLIVNAGTVKPKITGQPATQIVTESVDAIFSVTASGSQPFTYQWFKNGAPISGATEAGYTAKAVPLSDNGAKFKVIVSNAAGVDTSADAFLVVNQGVSPAHIATAPSNQTVTEGQAAHFHAVATGTAPLVYQWFKNGVAVAGAADTGLTISAAALADNGAKIKVLVSNANGKDSAEAFLFVNPAPVVNPPVITSEPSSRAVVAGDTVGFSVVATGDAPLAYQWYRNGALLNGATTTAYKIASAALSDSGVKFKVVVSNAGGKDTSAEVLLTVSSGGGGGTPPLIVVQPGTGKSRYDGDSVTYWVQATGSAPLSYQWRKNGVDIPGAVKDTLFLDSVWRATDNGATFNVIVTNSAGSVGSNLTTLAVLAATLQINVPNGGEKYPQGAQVPVSWTRKGVVRNPIRLDYTTGSGWINGPQMEAGPGSFTWTAPNVNSTSVKVRLINTVSAQIYDSSSAVFAILADTTGVNKLDPGEATQGFELLFDGTFASLKNNWCDYARADSTTTLNTTLNKIHSGDGDWFTHTGTTTPIRTIKQYGDFELRFEYRGNGRGEVLYRHNLNPTPDQISQAGVGMGVGDYPTASVVKKQAGSAFGLYAPSVLNHMDSATGWNIVRIVVHGDSVEHYHNGVKVTGYRYHTADFWKRADSSGSSIGSIAPCFTNKVCGDRNGGYLEKGYIGIALYNTGVNYRRFRIAPWPLK